MLQNKTYKKLISEPIKDDVSRLKMLYVIERDYGWIKTLTCGREQVLGLMNKDKLYTEKDAEDPVIPDDESVPVFHMDMECIKFKPGKVLMVTPVKRIPKEILLRARAIFQLIHDAIATEAVVYALYNIETQEFNIHLCPEQKLNGAHYEVSKEYLNTNICNRTNEVLAFEFHSHPFGHTAGFFSGTDDGNVDNLHTRVYGNITFATSGNKFGFIRCKFHDFKDFMDPSIFFEDIPNPEEVIDPGALVTDEEKQIIAVIAENNKKPTHYKNPYYGQRDHRGAIGFREREYEYEDYMWRGDGGPTFYEADGRGIDDHVPLLDHRGGKGQSHKDNFCQGRRGNGNLGNGRNEREMYYNSIEQRWVSRAPARFTPSPQSSVSAAKKNGRFPSSIYHVEWTSRLVFGGESGSYLESCLDNSSDDLFLAVEKDVRTGNFVLVAKESMAESYTGEI